MSADQYDDGSLMRFGTSTGPRPAQATDEASEATSVTAVSTRFVRSTTGGSEHRARAEKTAPHQGQSKTPAM